MKKLNFAVLPAPGLLNVDLKGMQTPSARFINALVSLFVILDPIIRIVVYFVTLVIIFSVMFGFFVMAAIVKEPSVPTKSITIIEGGIYGTNTESANSQPPRI
jgi:hypothetical protein